MEKIFVIVPNNDAESKAIINMLNLNSVYFMVTSQKWGASWENLEWEIKHEIKIAQMEGYKVFGVELQGEAPMGCINIDHHVYDGDDRSNKLTSIEQIAGLIGVPHLSEYEKAVSLNDVGYIPAMLNAGIPWETIQQVRLNDRLAQGITVEHEDEAIRAINEKEVVGTLTIVKMAHSKCATVTDRLFGQYTNLLILSGDGESNFYGDGEIVTKLHEKFAGWMGGQLPISGFWGGYCSDQDEIEKYTKSLVVK